VIDHPQPASETEAPAAQRDNDDNRVKLEALYERHYAELLRYVRRTFGRGPPEPEDAVQAAFAHYAALLQPDVIDNPRAFLYRAVRNLVIDQRRRALVRRRAAERGEIAILRHCADELDGERVLEGKERLRLLEATIHGMSPRLRDALLLYRIKELTFAEIARTLRISETEAKRSVSKALLICTRALRTMDGEL
jgi:RNA polymerase sigma factor (sigma-70 family)